MNEDTAFEIDEPRDWVIVESLMKRYQVKKNGNETAVKMFLTDCDGCRRGEVAWINTIFSKSCPAANSNMANSVDAVSEADSLERPMTSTLPNRSNVALIPVRGGSKSVPLKNIKEILGQPLVYWIPQKPVLSYTR